MSGRVAWWLLLGALSAPAGATAQAVADARLTRGMLAFDAKATLGAFTGLTNTTRGALVGAPTLAEAHGWVEGDTRTLVTGNGKRDRDMYASLEVEHFPTMRYDLARIEVGAAQGDSTAVTLQGSLTVHGVKREVPIPGWVWMHGGVARFRGATPLNLKDYQIGGLKKALGILRMNEHITVRIDVTFSG